MKFLFAHILLILSFGKALSELCLNENVQVLFWNEYKKIFNKTFTPAENQQKQQTFYNCLSHIMKHNSEALLGKYSYFLDVNQFCDQTPEEVVERHTGYLGDRPHPTYNPIAFVPSEAYIYQPNNTQSSAGQIGSTAPDLSQQPCYFRYQPKNGGNPMLLPCLVDWRQEGVVTDVKNQGNCGACWAFTASGSLEGQLARRTGKLISLSEQNLIDCSSEDLGCKGGWVDTAFEFVKHFGIANLQNYPYTAQTEQCHYQDGESVTGCQGFAKIAENDETQLLVAVSTIGPVSVAINAGLKNFQSYKYGIYDDSTCNPNVLNHGVLIVGYGIENGISYWLIKNSWGTTWGIDGYMKIVRNKNMCGIASRPIFPII